MKKRTYQSKEINQINWELVKKEINGEYMVFAVDVAKTMQFALLGDEHGRCAKIIRWEHPQETDLMLTRLAELECPVTVVMDYLYRVALAGDGCFGEIFIRQRCG